MLEKEKAGSGCYQPIVCGGGAENRTPVHTRKSLGRYKLSRRKVFSEGALVDEQCLRLIGSIFIVRHTDYVRGCIPLM